MSDLFDVGPKVPRSAVRGYAAIPGAGPKIEYANVYHKCALMEAVWTGGTGTDIRVRSPACRLWEAKP
jgi:hypothetical protein